MTQEELDELAMLEGPVKTLTPKPIVSMTDEELESFVTGMRDVTTQFQTLIAQAKVRKDGADKPDVNENLFE